jgi:hypothetical protein
VHWLTWKEIWHFLTSWQGIGATIVAFYLGVNQVLKTWDDLWYRWFDSRVVFLVEQRKIIPGNRYARQSPFGSALPTEIPYSVKEIAEKLGSREFLVRWSLDRLRRGGKLEPYQDGWRLKS